MIPKKEFRELLLEIYPSKSFRQSCVRCSKDTGAGLEYIYKMGMDSSNNAVRKPFYLLLKFKKDIIQLKKESFSINSQKELNKKNYERMEERKQDIKRLIKNIQLEFCDYNKSIVTKFENLTKKLN